MLSNIVWRQDIVGETTGNHHLAGVQLDTGVPEPWSELEVGATHPGAGLVLEVHPPAVAQGVQMVVKATVYDKPALLLPCLNWSHRLPGSANRYVLSRVIAYQ